MTHPRLFTPPPATNLPPRQQQAYDILTTGPLTSRQLGHQMHRLNGCKYCTETHACHYAQPTGEALGKTLRQKGHTIKRRNTHWTLTQPPKQPFDDLPEHF